MAVVLEAVTSSSERLDARIDVLEARLSERISALEQVVREHSERISGLEQVVREHSERISSLEQVVRGHSERISGLESEVARLRHDFEHREERGRMQALEIRVAALEARLGLP